MRLTLAVCFGLFVSSPLFAGPITGTVSGSFPTGDSIQLPDGGALLKIGTPESSLIFASAGSFSALPGEAFYLGSFRFSGHSMGDANTEGTFQAAFHFANLEGVSGAQFNYDLTLSQNPKNLVETISLNGTSEESFRFPNGQDYTLLLSGFSPTRDMKPGDYLKGSFEASFCDGGEGFLYGAFVPVGDDPPQVPEPSALILLGVAVGFVSLRRWWI